MNKKENSIFQSRGMALVLFFFLLILIMAFIFGDRGLLEIIKTQKQISAMKQTLKELESEKARLTKEIKMLKENPLAIEQQAREKLWLMKKSEKVIVLVDGKEGGQHE